MSDAIKHECGIALLRLLKPLPFYKEKYKTNFYGLEKLYLLLEKQHNRGQDGVGIACLKLDVEIGKEYLAIEKSNAKNGVEDVIKKAYRDISKLNNNFLKDATLNDLKNSCNFVGEILLGHLRYGTFGGNDISNLHPFEYKSNYLARHIILSGNFNMTNIREITNMLVNLGQHPRGGNDTNIILDHIVRLMTKHIDSLVSQFKNEGSSKKEISERLRDNVDIIGVLTKAIELWDGGFVMNGLLANGDAFVIRDRNGIRPAYYYKDDEVVVVTSERPVIQTVMGVNISEVKEIPKGHILLVKRNGEFILEKWDKEENSPSLKCSFERIYFSRGTDASIYKERKELGRLLTEPLAQILGGDFKDTILSYIPNTASVASLGLAEGIEHFLDKKKIKEILSLKESLNKENLSQIIYQHPRVEAVAVKDLKIRTFITNDESRNNLVSYVYDVTYGLVKDDIDTLIVLDDSIVRGTTLKQSIIRMLDRLKPKRIIIVSSAPQIRYPDCYGIDMARLGDFIAFKAIIELLKENKKEHLIDTVYQKCKEKEQEFLDTEKAFFDKSSRIDDHCHSLPKALKVENYVKDIYKEFSVEVISKKIASLVTPEGTKAKVDVLFQSIENLHRACPDNKGDWYFTGDYPTLGGFRAVNRAFINYVENNTDRAY